MGFSILAVLALPSELLLPFVITGGCASLSAVLDGVEYTAAGYTASGAPYYRDSSLSYYIYWDPDCNGAGEPARWIVDNEEPSTSASSDLDGDGQCAYYAHTSTRRTPPRRRSARRPGRWVATAPSRTTTSRWLGPRRRLRRHRPHRRRHHSRPCSRS